MSAGPARVAILLGNGTGGFSLAPSIALGIGAYLPEILSADFNLDGKPDLIVISSTLGGGSPVSAYTLLLGAGNGGFTIAASKLVGLSLDAAVTADFNRDGKPDLAVTDFLTGRVIVLQNDGSGNLTDLGGIPSYGFNPTALAAADFNNDGLPDLAVFNNGQSSVTVLLNAISPVSGAPPFGVVDTPAGDPTSVSGAVAFTGWALGELGVTRVSVWRESANGNIFLGDATIVPGARPDVARAYPGYPNNSAGWGVQILTNVLPDGAYRIHAIASDTRGQSADLGARTINVDNAHAVLPFGALDTPQQGGVASGSSYVNFGWALTANASSAIPKDGSTIWVYVDNFPLGHPVYNNNRFDISSLFPGLPNSNGAVGYFIIDTTRLLNGLHTISWSVTDDAGHTQGIGSRFFTVQN